MATSDKARRERLNARSAVRLRLAGGLDPRRLDGGWWPRSRDLGAELGHLLRSLPPEVGRVRHVAAHHAGWRSHGDFVEVDGYAVKLGELPDGNEVVLTSARGAIRLLVVPVLASPDDAATAMLASSTSRNRHSASEVLASIASQPETVSSDRWEDDGGNWWSPHPTPPSYRRRR